MRLIVCTQTLKWSALFIFFLFTLKTNAQVVKPGQKPSVDTLPKKPDDAEKKKIEEWEKLQQAMKEEAQGADTKPQNTGEKEKADTGKPQKDSDVAFQKKSDDDVAPYSFIYDSLDNYIERGMKQWQVPGLAIAIVKDGRVVLMKGYGVRELGKEDKVDENTLFIIASNSKLFTGTALAKLDYEKKLSLNDKVTKFIPWFRLYDSSATTMANIRDMLCHRIGTKTFQGDFTFWDSNLPKDSIVWKMRYLKPVGEFRQDYGYCNSAFLVAGQVLEKVTGTSWENYVQQNILTPLGMTNTYMNTAGLAGRSNVAFPHNNLYSPLTKIPFDNVDNLGPATSMVSNVKDLSKWIMLQLDSGRYNGRRILPWEVLRATRDANILTGSRKSTAYPTHFRAYGLGVYSTDYAGRQVYWHTGGAFGQVTNVCFVPEENLGITILTNNDNQNFFEALRYQVLDAYLNQPYTDRSAFQFGFFQQGATQNEKELAALKARVDKKNQPALKLDDYTGEYVNTVYGKITIRKSNNMLICHFQHHPDLIGYMEYMDNNEFRITYSNIGYGIHPAKFTVKDGKAVAVEIRANDFVEYDAYLFVKVPNGMVIR
jgi:CubicO group peptidase (beta-lactamase class C family)